MFFIAEGRCEGAVTGRFRGANFPRNEGADGHGPFLTTSGPSLRPTTEPRSWLSGTGMGAPPPGAPPDRRRVVSHGRPRAIPPAQRRGPAYVQVRSAMLAGLAKAGPDLALDVAELIWEPIAE